MTTGRAAQLCARRGIWSATGLVGLILLCVSLVMWFAPGRAAAQGPAVTLDPAGPYTDGQMITVSGSGFPARSDLPTGLQIIECSDPGGTPDNLPTDPASGCDGTTVNGLQINTDANGNFSASYGIIVLNSSDSSINCDDTNFCVLWVGQDFNNAFLSGPHGFSSAFTISSGTSTTTTEATTTTTQPTGTTTTEATTTTTQPEATTTTSVVETTTTTQETGTTTTSPGGTTTTSSAGTTTTTSSGTTTTFPPGSTTSIPGTIPAGNTGGGGGPSSASSGQLSFTGPPPFIPILAIVGLSLCIVGLVGRRAVPRGWA